MSCSREEMYQALPALPYCKRRKAGRGTGNEATFATFSGSCTPAYTKFGGWGGKMWGEGEVVDGCSDVNLQLQ